MKRFIGFLWLGCVMACAFEARAQMVVVASVASPATMLTAEQAGSLFLGRRRSLPGVERVTVVDQPEATAMRDRFYDQLTGKTAFEVRAIWSRLVFSGKSMPPRQASNSAEVKRLLAANPLAVGYIEMSAVDATVKVLLALN